MKIKNIAIIFLCIILIAVFSIKSFAYKLGNDITILVNIKKMPIHTEYIDILIPNKEKPNYIPFDILKSLDGGTIHISKDCEIAQYDDGEYISYSVYISNDLYVDYENDNTIRINYGLKDQNIKNEYSCIKLAYIDEYGKVIEVSNEININDYYPFEFHHLSLSGNEVKSMYRINPFFTVISIVVILLAILIIIMIIKKVRRIKNHALFNSVSNSQISP